MTGRIVAVVLALSPVVGCTHPDRASESLHGMTGVPVEKPDVPEASVEAAARVDEIGRELLAGTPLGIPDVAFHTIGSPEPEVFHHDSNTLYITEGMVNLCRSDDELAAVLATEVGRMTAEFRRSVRMRHPDPIPKAASPAPLDRTTDYDPGRDLYLAQFEKNARKPSDNRNAPPMNPTTITEELLRNSGRDRTLLAEIEPHLQLARRNHQMAQQLGGRPPQPKWSQ